MDKGETVMPVPEGIISTSTGPAEAVQEVTLEDAMQLLQSQGEFIEKLEKAIAAADAEEAVEEYDLPELS
jgi:hypothetical protein